MPLNPKTNEKNRAQHKSVTQKFDYTTIKGQERKPSFWDTTTEPEQVVCLQRESNQKFIAFKPCALDRSATHWQMLKMRLKFLQNNWIWIKSARDNTCIELILSEVYWNWFNGFLNMEVVVQQNQTLFLQIFGLEAFIE